MNASSKADWRARCLEARRAMPASRREDASEAIAGLVQALPVWHRAQTVGLYVSLPDEVSTWPLLHAAWAAQKKTAAPVIHTNDPALDFRLFARPTDLLSNPRGILQPETGQTIQPDQLDLLLVPGVGFDRQGHRLGFGKGYYDRFLAGCRAVHLGLAFELQVFDALPVADHDIRMDGLVTENGVTWFPKAG